ncbi:MAG TPA: HyaD/HybD family hydrogenase maturation endopeptidase [Bryobacteraceae bacterium]|nr:HyaD/HybD family hydrogenase maturation endopeptidase [Bryobacteraceae bacterium]
MSIAVLGLGNVLMGDDGAGPYALAVFQAEYQVPPEVTVVDLGTPGLDLAPYLAGAGSVLLVDTVRAEGTPGSIHTYNKAALMRGKASPRVSPHDPAVGECLAMLELAGSGPRQCVLVGIAPESTAFGACLTRAIRAAIPAVVARMVAELRAWGAVVTPRHPQFSPDIWWEMPAAGPV